MENRQGEVNNSMGNGEAKELIFLTHRHELRGGRVACRVEGNKGKKKLGQL